MRSLAERLTYQIELESSRETKAAERRYSSLWFYGYIHCAMIHNLITADEWKRLRSLVEAKLTTTVKE